MKGDWVPVEKEKAMTVISIDYAITLGGGKKSAIPSFTYAELARGAAAILEDLRSMQDYVDVIKIRLPKWSADFGGIEIDMEVIFSRIGIDKAKKIEVQHHFTIELPWLEWCSSSCRASHIMVSEMRPKIVEAMQGIVMEYDMHRNRFLKQAESLLPHST